MLFEFHRIESLPRLAWCARVRRAHPSVQVVHGGWLETRDGWFVEGAWSGSFASGDFINATTLLGSGGRTSPEAVTFAPASHSLERLQFMRLTEDEVLVSNSLAFLLVQAEDGPHPAYFFYEQDLRSFVDGLSKLVQCIPTHRGRRVELVYCSNLIIDRTLGIRMQRRNEPRPFLDYGDYIAFLQGELGAIHRNATDPARRHAKYEPLATVSTGYDSPACAVLAKMIGCTQAVTIREARPEEFGDAVDSGRAVGQALGLTVAEYERLEYLRRIDLPEAEFLAVGTGGEDVVMSAFEPQLSRRMLLTGFRGDTLWSRLHACPEAAEDFGMKDPSGSSLTEFRLRVGFVHAPVPMIAFTRHPSLHRIANSEAMKPWRAPNPRYDRPVARRLLEEAGVPGHLFGQTKLAVTQPFYRNEPLREIMSPQSYGDFRAFAGEPRDLNAASGHAIKLAILPIVHRMTYVLVGALRRVAGSWGIAVPRTGWVARHYRQRLTENALTFHWAQEKLRSRYAVAMVEEPGLHPNRSVRGTPVAPGRSGPPEGPEELQGQGRSDAGSPGLPLALSADPSARAPDAPPST